MGDGGSIWKKEISLGRKAKEPNAPKAPEAEQPSVWKKELSFSRKPKAPADPAQPAEAAQPFWKKEISVGRGKKSKPEPELAEPQVPWWKKEISLGAGKDKAKEREVARLAEEAAAAVVAAPAAEPAAPVPPPVPAVPAPPPEPIPVAAAPPEPEPPEPAPVAAPPTPVPVPVPEAPVLPPGAEALYAASEPAPAPEPVAAGPAPAPAAPAVEEDTAVLPAAAVTPQQVVHPPVPASELPPLPPAAKAPWWKKELGGGKKAKSSSLLPEDDDTPKAPWWKKELGGGRKPKAAARDPEAPTAAKVPWWKKELGGAKKPKPAAAAAVEPAAPKAKTPFWKKELSLARKPKPRAGAAPAPKPAKRGGGSFLKLDLGSLSLPSFSLARQKRDQKLKKVVGLKVGGSQIAAARVVNNGHAELLQVARQPLEQGVVVAGELRDPEALTEQLKSFFARHKLPRRNVRLGIASNRIGVRIFDVAGIVDDKALTNAIQFRAQEALPIPLDEAVLDYQVLGETVDGEGQPVKRILLVVAYRELVDRYIAACRKAGITLVGIDLEAFALLRALGAPRPETTDATAATVAVAVGHDRSTFAVSDGRICEFTRVLEWGGAAVNIGLARALDLAPSEVEGIKRQLQLDGSATPDGLTAEQYATAVDAVRKQIQSFARELVSSLQFYQNQPGSLGIGEIVLSGGTAHLPGLADELQRLIGVAVRVGDPLARVKVGKKVGSPEQVGSFAVAIGLGIED